MAKQKVKKMTLTKSLLSLLFLVLVLISIFLQINGKPVIWHVSNPHMGLIAATVFAAIMGVAGGFTWKEMEEGVLEAIRSSMLACLILMVMGCLIGVWMVSGIIPTMMYYGLKIITPAIFLLVACLIAAIVSTLAGNSWATIAMVGVALLGIGSAFGISPGMCAGAIISGSYFGEMISKKSKSTEMAVATAESDLSNHGNYIRWTTVPALVIALIIFAILGFTTSGASADSASATTLMEGIKSTFVVSPLLLIPPILVIVLLFLRVPALPSLLGGVILGGIFAALVQHSGMTSILDAAHYGFSGGDLGLISGGLDNMLKGVSLIFCAMAFGGVMHKTKQLETIGMSLMKLAKGAGSLIFATVITSIVANFIRGDQFLSISITGNMYKDLYKEKGLDPVNLSRTLEDAGTATSPLVPWSTCGAAMNSCLGVSIWSAGGYAPFALLNLLCPLIAMFFGFTGIGIKKAPASAGKKAEI